MNFDNNFFQAVLQNVADGIVACDENGVLIFFNSALEKIHHQPLKPLMPDEWAKAFPPTTALLRGIGMPMRSEMRRQVR